MKIKKLEAIRGFAAIYVVCHHFIGFSILKTTISPIARFPFRFGQEAVMLFFLLSGFVIYLSVHNRSKITFKKYFLKRFVRIYPILIFSFLISILISIANHYTFTIADLKQLIGNIFMQQDTTNKPGIAIQPFLKNDPLWSLSYEWWFYMLFFPLFILREKFNSSRFIYIILAISAVSWLIYLKYPNHSSLVLSYFIIWWCGVECAEVYVVYKAFTFKTLLPVLICLLIMTCLGTIPIIIEYYNGVRKFSQIEYPIITFRHYLFSFVVILIGLFWWKLKLVYFNNIFAHFETLSIISYSVYIIHFPFIWLQISFVGPYVAILFKLVMIFIISWFLEVKVQPVINTLFFKVDNKMHKIVS